MQGEITGERQHQPILSRLGHFYGSRLVTDRGEPLHVEHLLAQHHPLNLGYVVGRFSAARDFERGRIEFQPHTRRRGILRIEAHLPADRRGDDLVCVSGEPEQPGSTDGDHDPTGRLIDREHLFLAG